jgi:hypothetical protein
VAVHDGWAPHWRFEDVRHALCGAHLLRELEAITKEPGQGMRATERGHDPDTLVRQMTGRTPDRVQDEMVSDEATSHLFDRLVGPDGLTATASTFACPEVLVALGAGLAGAGRTELEELADRFLAERAVSVVADRALEERR